MLNIGCSALTGEYHSVVGSDYFSGPQMFNMWVQYVSGVGGRVLLPFRQLWISNKHHGGPCNSAGIWLLACEFAEGVAQGGRLNQVLQFIH